MSEGNKLHQLLAVEDDLRGKSTLILNEAKNTFTKKQEHFDGLTKVYHPFKDTEGQEVIPPEIKEVVTTVADKTTYALETVIRALDARASINETNSSGRAIADLTVDETKFGSFSATTLLELEKTLASVRDMYHDIPTLDPARQWSEDKDAGKNLYRTGEEVKTRTNKIQEPLVLYPATEKHPAQVQLITRDIQQGLMKTTYTSGKITPANKSKLLSRLDELILAVKQARVKANQADVVNVSLGKNIFDYINEGIF